MKKTIRLYAVGGAGCNIAKLVEGTANNIEGMANLDICYVDTSLSNVRGEKVDENRFFKIEGDNLDGAAKIRKDSHPHLAKALPKIMDKFRPTAFNIVVSSASGGTGSVAAFHVVSEILKRGDNAVLILVGTTDSVQEITNTIATLKSFDGLAHSVGRPVAVHYLQNTQTATRAVINNMARQAIVMLSALMSNEHHELDTADVKGWLNHSSIYPELVSVQFAQGQTEYNNAGEVITVATLATHDMVTAVDPVPAYQAVGYVPHSWTANNPPLIGKEPIHYTLSANMVSKVSGELNKLHDDLKSRQAAMTRRERLTSTKDVDAGDGLIL